MKKLFIIPLSLILLFACENPDIETDIDNQNIVDAEPLTVSMETALDILDDFMQKTESEFMPTKSGNYRVIETVDEYYLGGSLTKSDGLSLPSAYIVNYAENEGFAVLGANTSMPPIIAVTEKGSLNPNSLEVVISNEGTNDISTFDDIDWETFDFYCPEDDDYYVMGNDQFVSDMIGNVLTGPGGFYVPEPHESSDNPVVQTVAPLLNINWNQGQWENPDVYNKYCIKNNGKYAYSGCTTTALAMIMAHNEFPKRFKVNGNELIWTDMKQDADAHNLNAQAQEHVSLLFGAIYNNVKHSSTSRGTLITPKQIELFMNKCNFSNVKRHCDSDFTESMQRITETHLRNGKPVFISAIKNINVFSGHSWVIDGMNHDRQGNRMFHFNFGWGGTCNGYFSLACFNPVQAESFDTQPTPYQIEYYDCNYNNHFRLISYDIPDQSNIISMSF